MGLMNTLQGKNPKFDRAGVVVAAEGNPDDPSKKRSVMDLVEATLSPHLRAEKLKKAENKAARQTIPEELKGRRRGVLPRGFRGGFSAALGSANKENVPPPLRDPNLRGHHCSIDDELTDEEQVRLHNVS